jgi:DNA-binding winged helix-turn-helix (wHTH) protein/tetratricopeptide (TPR) repeat protein
MRRSARRYEFGPFQLNPNEGSLVAAGVPVALAPKPFDVLRVLVEHHGHVVLKSDLMTTIWPDTAVEDANLTVSVSVLRKTLARSEPASPYIQTVPKRGYRFVGDVHEIADDETNVVNAIGSLATAGRIEARHFVGRERELATLGNALISAADGRSTFVAITGEPGIGKTSLIDDFLHRTPGGCLVARGRCVEHLGSVDAFLPILEALNGLVGRREDVLALMKDCAPTWYAEIETSDAGPFREGQNAAGSAPNGLHGQLSRFVREVTRRAPLVLVLDDLHWSDGSTIALLELLTSRFRVDSTRLLIVAAYRPSVLLADAHPYLALERQLRTRGTAEELALTSLSRVDIEQYVRTRFPQNRLSARFVDAIHRTTEGNPLFLVDLVTDLIRRGVLTKHDDTWVVSRGLSDWQGDVPTSVRAMVDRTIRQLDAFDQSLLGAAAIQGSEFDSSILAMSVDIDPAWIEERLTALSNVQGILRPAGRMSGSDDSEGARFAFVHTLHRDALYSALSPTRKALLSGAVARAILECHRDHVEEVAPTLALLFETARDPAHASEYALVAAQHAARMSGYREAIALARRGLHMLELLPPGPEHAYRELMLLLTLAGSLGATDGYGAAEVRTVYRRARELCGQIGDPLPVVPVLIGLWSSHAIKGEFAAADEFARELIVVSDEADVPGLKARARLLHGSALAHLGRLTEGCEELERARAALSTGPDPCPFILDAGIHTLCELAEYLCILGFVDRGLERVAEALALADQLGDPYNVTFAHVFAAITHRRRGETDMAADRADAAIAAASQHELTDGLMFARALRGWALCHSGHVTEGVAFIHRALTASRAGAGPVPFLAMVAESCADAGRQAEGIAAVDLAISTGERGADRFCLSELYRLRGELLLLGGTTTSCREAERHFGRAIEVARSQGARLFELLATMRLCRLRHEAEDHRTQSDALAAVYDSFTEGLRTPALLEARALLDALG